MLAPCLYPDLTFYLTVYLGCLYLASSSVMLSCPWHCTDECPYPHLHFSLFCVPFLHSSVSPYPHSSVSPSISRAKLDYSSRPAGLLNMRHVMNNRMQAIESVSMGHQSFDGMDGWGNPAYRQLMHSTSASADPRTSSYTAGLPNAALAAAGMGMAINSPKNSGTLMKLNLQVPVSGSNVTLSLASESNVSIGTLRQEASSSQTISKPEGSSSQLTRSLSRGSLGPSTIEAFRFLEEAVWNNFLFSWLAPDQRRIILGLFEQRIVQTGDIIIRQGEPGDHYYVVESGKFDVYLQQAGSMTVSCRGSWMYTFNGHGHMDVR